MNTQKIKNKEDTKAKLVTAVGDVLAEKGFAKIGINAVARQAGVDKVLIYRYFNDLNGLMAAYAESSVFWPSAKEIIGEGEEFEQLLSQPFSQALSEVFRRYAKALRSRPLTLEILAWETIERNVLTISLEEVRERFGLELMDELVKTDPPQADWQAITNIFTGAIHYLAIRGRKISTFSGMKIDDDDSWERLVNSIEFLLSNVNNKR